MSLERICAWCEGQFGVQEGMDRSKVTHGICRRHLVEVAQLCDMSAEEIAETVARVEAADGFSPDMALSQHGPTMISAHPGDARGFEGSGSGSSLGTEIDHRPQAFDLGGAPVSQADCLPPNRLAGPTPVRTGAN